jgi:hypothetical protein
MSFLIRHFVLSVVAHVLRMHRYVVPYYLAEMVRSDKYIVSYVVEELPCACIACRFKREYGDAAKQVEMN